MQKETLKLVLLALEDGTPLSCKVLVMFVVQKLENNECFITFYLAAMQEESTSFTEASASGIGGWDTAFLQGIGDVCGPEA